MVSLCVVCRVAEVGKLSRTQRRQERRVTRNLCPLMLKYPPLGPLLRLRTPTISESTSSAFSDFGATSPYTNLETAVERGDAADCVGGTPYRIFRRQNVNSASYDRACACATTTSAGRPSTSRQMLTLGECCGRGKRAPCSSASPLWQRQPPAICVNCGMCAYAASLTERATGTGALSLLDL